MWPKKSAMAIEEYVFARFYMYQNVYLHKTTRCFEAILRAMWRRAAWLREHKREIAALPALRALWSVEKPSPRTLGITQYMSIEEFTVLGQMQVWMTNQDPVLSDLARRFMNRDGFAMIELPSHPASLRIDYSGWMGAVHGALRRHGFQDPEYYCLTDEIKPKYRRPYQPEKDEQTPTNSIFIENDAGRPVEISTVMPRLQPITAAQAQSPRFYVPRERPVREEITAIARAWKW